MIHDAGRVRRLVVLAAAGVALLAMASGTAVLAGTSGSKAPSEPAAATASLAAPTSAPAADQSNPFHAAVVALVADGTINQHQADVLDEHIDAGSINPQELIDGGVLTAAQMQTVNARLTAIKQSLPAGPADKKESAASDATKRAESDAARVDEAAAHAAFDAAIAALVADGTIDQAQANVLRQGIEAGTIDEQALIDNGTVTEAQMKAVQTRLSAVKESFASTNGPSSTAPTSKDTSKTK